MPYKSRAQQGFMHAAEERGEMPHGVVEKFDKATSKKQFARLPEHAKKHAMGGYGHGGEVECPACGHKFAHGGEVEHGDETEGGECRHYSHGGKSFKHDPECMARGGKASKHSEGGEREFAQALRQKRGY